MTGALDGVRVVDFGQYVAGPMAGMLLADQGADVIHVEAPGGPRFDTPANEVWNRGKRSIVLDLKQAADLEVAKGLVASADVVIENFRPGVMERLGLGAAELCEQHSRLIYCSMPGFAADDPRAATAAWEGVVGAATALYRTPGNPEPDRPIYTALSVASSYAAIQGVVAITMALNERERSGLGQRIEVPLFDAMFAPMGGRAMIVHRPFTPQSRGGGLWSGPFRCRDGRWIYFSAAGNQNFREFIEAAGIADWDREGLTDRERLGREPDLAAEQARRMRALFETRTAQEWEDLVAEAGSEGAVCRTAAEWLVHPHAEASKAVVDVPGTRFGVMRQPGVNPRLRLTPGTIRSAAPAPDADRASILEDLARPRAAAASGIETELRSALEGIKVLDLCIILAGPTAGRTLAEFGADVIKIDDPKRGFVVYHTEINRGKRSILLDLRREEGRDVFWKLLEDADVVVQNYRSGRVDALGIGYEEVRRRRPDIVYASLNAYGHEGPWAPRPGHEQFAQAASGMQLRYGGDGTPVVQPYPINDFGTGFLGAYAIALALLHRQRTGEGQHVDTSLVYTAGTLQSLFFQGYEGKRWDESRGQDALGSSPWHRAYRASDGWVFIAVPASKRASFESLQGMAGIAALAPRDLEARLESAIATASVGEWVARLHAIDVGAHRVVFDMRELLNDPWVQQHGLSITREHDDWGPITTTGPTQRLSRTPVVPGRPAPRPGSHAREILEEAGLGDRFDVLRGAGVIVTEGVQAMVGAALR
ncbi:MAG: CoA transferase [Dehalococcoidia bacterium]